MSGLEIRAYLGLNKPQITCLFKDLYEEIIIRNPKQVGLIGSRWSLEFRVVRFRDQRFGSGVYLWLRTEVLFFRLWVFRVEG